jgi:hypothetical protein
MSLRLTDGDENRSDCGRVDSGEERERSRPLWMC